MWVCKLVTIIEVEEEVSGGPIVVIIVVAGSAAQDDRGRRQAAVREAGVDTWEASIRREEGIQVGMRLNRGVRCGDALPRLLHGGDMAPVAELRELHAAERRHPCTHVVPYRRPTPIPGAVVVGGGATMAVLERHDAMAAKAAGKLRESDGVDVAAGRGGARDDGEACRGDGIIERTEEVGRGARWQGADEVAQARPHAEA